MISKVLFTLYTIVLVSLTVASGFALASYWDRVDHTIIYILTPLVLLCDYLVIRMMILAYQHD